jgi:hypothetical protein
MNATENELIIYPNKKNLIKFVIFSVVYIIFGLFIAINYNYKSLEFDFFLVFIASYLGVPFFILSLIFSLDRLIWPKPIIIINNEGIYNKASWVGVGLIKWEEIERIFLSYFLRQRFIGIVPKDLNCIFNRIGKIKKFILKINKAGINAPMIISEGGLDCSIEELLKYIEKYMKK